MTAVHRGPDSTGGIQCPKCQRATTVVDSRGVDGAYIRRRRSCFVCAHRFTTYEVLVENVPGMLPALEEIETGLKEMVARLNDMEAKTAELASVLRFTSKHPT